MRLLDFSGKVLLDQTKEVQMPAQSSAIYFSVDQGSLSAKGDPRKSFLSFDLQVAGKQISRNLIFFRATHDLELPVAPKIENSLTKVDGGYNLILKTAALARNVYISMGDLDVQMSDNYFDLLPGETMTIALKTSSTLENLQGVLKITSLTEAFNSN
jgi:beta-mannosidase